MKENKARNEATIEGIENRKKDLLYSVKNELNIDNEESILPQSDLNQFHQRIYHLLKSNLKKQKK